MRKTCTLSPLPQGCFLQFPSSARLGNTLLLTPNVKQIMLGRTYLYSVSQIGKFSWIEKIHVPLTNLGEALWRFLHCTLIIVALIKNVFLYLSLWLQGFLLFQDGVRLENPPVLTSSVLQWHKQNIKYINLHINVSNVANRVDNIKWGKPLYNQRFVTIIELPISIFNYRIKIWIAGTSRAQHKSFNRLDLSSLCIAILWGCYKYV